MKIIRYINNQKIDGVMPSMQIENPVTVTMLRSLREQNNVLLQKKQDDSAEQVHA